LARKDYDVRKDKRARGGIKKRGKKRKKESKYTKLQYRAAS
jgi:hypothetical protein